MLAPTGTAGNNACRKAQAPERNCLGGYAMFAAVSRAHPHKTRDGVRGAVVNGKGMTATPRPFVDLAGLPGRSGDVLQLADNADEVALGGGTQVLVAPDGSSDTERRRLSAREQVIGAHAEPVAESDKQVERGHCVSALDTRYVLVRNAKLRRELFLGELEGVPLSADAMRNLEFRGLLHARKPPKQGQR
jgi:hypothetical protein